MPSVAINPGSGPANGATVEHAETNIRTFVDDLRLRGRQDITFERREGADYGEGRFCWVVSADGAEPVEVQMPGLPLERVRWLGHDQDIWAFPRLYVDDGSWIWFFALDQFEPDGYTSRQPDNTVSGGEPYVFTRVTLNAEEG